jgi:hypothetical protein
MSKKTELREKHIKRRVHLLNESVLVDTYFLYEFLRRLVKPFKETEAFKLGIIDERGKILKRRSQLQTAQEKRAFSMFDLLVWNLKKILERIPFGRSRLASYAAALFLLREDKYLEYYAEDVELLTESYMDFYEGIDLDLPTKYSIIKLIQELDNRKDFKLLFETPVNNVGDGKIAGASPGEQPVVKRKPKKLRRKPLKVCNNEDSKDVNIEKCNEEDTKKRRRGFRVFSGYS